MPWGNLFFPSRGGEDRLDGFLLGVRDEAAGIDQQEVHGTVLPFRDYLQLVLNPAQKMAGVDVILGAAQGDDLYGLSAA